MIFFYSIFSSVYSTSAIGCQQHSRAISQFYPIKQTTQKTSDGSDEEQKAALVWMTIGMNRPFDDVENHYLREVLHVAQPNYLAPSRRTHTVHFDSEAVVVQLNLMKDIVKDVNEAGHKTINITSDHGTSSDQFRAKKNALTVARCTKDFIIKKAIVKMIKCEGSQTGQKIREDVKQALQEQAGWEAGWTVNWVTDNESKQVNARHPNKHPEVGLETNYTGFE